jgi:hypothetical protein
VGFPHRENAIMAGHSPEKARTWRATIDAWVTASAETGQVPPDPERTRRLAYSLYEAELAAQAKGISRPHGTVA